MSDQALDELSVDEKRKLLAHLLRQKKAAPDQAVTPSGPTPLSFQQERLWVLEKLTPGSSAYNTPLAIRIRGRFDSAAWSRAFRSVIARHETLRSRFVEAADGPRQIADADSPSLDEECLDQPSREAARREARERFEQMADKPIELTTGPPWRARLIRIAEDEVLFALVVHHIVFDGRSALIFLNELLAGYRLELRGADSRRTPLALQYSDFARWQRRQLSGETMAALIDYWRETLDGVAQQDMPLDRPRPASVHSQSAICQRDVETDALRRIQDFGRRHGTIVYAVLVAAVQAVLARTCGQRDVVVGSAIMGRPRIELEGSIGFFANTLALRADIDPSLDFAGLVRQVRDTLKGALAHQDMPFERLVQELDIERVPDRHPLFQVCLNHLQVGASEARLPDARVDFLESTRQAAKFDLQIDFRELPSVLRINVTYNRDLFEPETIERLADRVVRLLLAGVEAPETPVRALPMIDAAEHRLLASEWASRRSAASGRSTLTSRLRHWVESTPDVVAAEDDASRLTYGALGRRSAPLARRLVDLGIGVDDRVGVCLGRAPDLVVALVAILRAGATYVPLDPEYPVDRLGAMVTDAAIRCVVIDAGRSDLVGELTARSEHPIDVVPVDAMERPGPDDPTGGPWVEVDPEHVANVIFTSGSTGRPKGVAVTHRSIVRLATADDSISVTPADRFSQMANIGFDASTLEIWGPLVHGARLVFVPRGDTLEPARLRARLVDRGITTMLVTSALVRTLIDAEPSMFAGVRQLFFGGEAADPRAIRRIARQPDPPTRLIHAYGPTESTVYATWFPVDDVAEGIQTLPIGRPVDGTTAHVVDPWLELVPIGVPGELLLGGEGLARGYVGRPAATAERFVPDPFGDVPGARLYRTGDRARWTCDGVLEFLGRTDDQVKLRGHRVELGEIEHALLDHPGVLEAAVRLLDAPSGAKLVAYWSGDQTVDLDSLIAHLRRRLPAIMIPSAILRLDALPLNANGKVDLGALPEPEETLGARVAPRTEMERRLATLWGELLDRRAISVHDDFFALGGHSLLAVRLAARMRDDLQLDVSVRHVLEAPTIASLATAIDRAGANRWPAVVSIGEHADYPLSFAQERMWFLEQLLDGQTVYTIPIHLRLSGRLDPEALDRAFVALVERHATLRTRIVDVEGTPRQRIEPVVAPLLSRLDVETADDPESVALQACREMLKRPFDLAAEPPLRALLVRLGPERHQLAMAVHHIATDGWSMEILLADWVAIYDTLRSGRDVAPRASALRYVDYVGWQRQHADAIVDEELSYWLGVFPAPPPVLELPTDHLRPPVPSYRAAAEPVHLDADASRRLLELAAADGGTPFMACLALYATWLWRLSGQTELVIGSPVAGRDRAELNEIVGLFVNTLAFAVDLDGRPSFRQLLHRVRSIVLGALTHQALPFDRLVDALQPERGQAHAPIVQVMLTVQTAQSGGAVFDGLDVEPVEQVPEALEVDWTLNLAQTENGFVGGLTYATDLFDAASIRDALGGLERLLTAVVEAPDRPLDALDLSTPAARHELLHVLAPGPAQGAAPDSPLDAIEARAARYPTAPAVRGVGLDGSIRAHDYGELTTASRRLARHLVARGVRPETRVGVAMPRSPELLVTLLAVLQAGGVWLPLDRDYPDERLRWLVADGLADQACSLLLTDEPSPWRRIVGSDEGDPASITVVDIAALLRRDDEPAGRVTLPRRLARHAAYVIYTSGTTGRPKGVVVDHGSLARQLDWIQAELPLDADDVLLQRTTIQFDVAMEEMLWPLMAGARIELAPPDLDAWQWVDQMETVGATLVETVPALLRTWLDTPGFDRLKSLRTIHCGGEAMPAELVRRFHERASRRPAGWPVLRLFNMYGPTETTITAFGGLVAASDDLSPPSDERPPLGRPVSDIQALVLDRELGLVPRGAYGELCLGGEQVARGYWRRPAATAERFVPNPFGAPGERLYRTGDRVRWRRDGRLDFAGRLDDQIELRGFRIEPGEVEAALRELAEVADAAVGLVTVDGVRRLVAWIVAADGIDREGLGDRSREAVARRLPAHMVPSIGMVLDALPRLPTGKLARRALPSPDVERTAYLAPRNALERSVVETFEAVLGRSGIGVRDDFFRLGGQSLLAARVVARLRRDVAVELSVGELLDASTPEALAELLRQRVGGDQAVRPALVRRSTEAPRELSFAQERLWFLDRLRPGGHAFNMPIALDLRGALDVDALARALTEIVERHAVLRGRLIASDDGPRVEIGPGLDGLPCHDLSRASDTTVDRWVRTVARRPFRLSEDVLIRAELALLADDADAERRYVLVVVTHHGASDGWSHDIFLQELMTLYEAYVAGRPSPLEPLAVDYADFAEWQRGWLVDDALDRQLDYWRRRLQDLPLLDLPFDRPRGTTQGEAGGWVGVALEPRRVRGLRRWAGDHGATLFMAVLACWQATLHRLGGSTRLAVGVPVSGRLHPDLEASIGLFVNTVVLCVDLSPDLTFRDVLERAREATAGGLDHQDVPFEKLVEALRPERHLGTTPLFQTQLLFHHGRAGELTLPDVAVKARDLDAGIARYELTLTLSEDGEGLRGALAYRRDLFDAATVESIARIFRRLVDAAVEDPGCALGALTLSTVPERQAQLTAWHGPTPVRTEAGPMDEIERWARCDPSRVALIDADGSTTTFAALFETVRQLDARLMAVGAGLESRVAILLDRSPTSVAALLAVFRRGAVVVPLDPEQPAARWRAHAARVQPVATLTSRDLASRAPSEGGALIVVDALEATAAQSPDRSPGTLADVVAERTDDALAFITFTSGSTGEPKPVGVSWRGVRSYLGWKQAVYPMDADDVVLAKTPAGFDAAIWEVLGPLAAGARVVLATDGGHRDAAHLASLMARHGVTLWRGVPTLLSEIVREPAFARCRALRRVFSVGEPLRRELVERLAASSDAELVNLYGPTETTWIACHAPIDLGPSRPAPGERSPPPIGRPIAGAALRVLDERLAPCPPGVVGEIYLAGEGVARGYVGQPGATAECFVPDPHAVRPGRRMYRTGDLGRWHASRGLIYLGRRDGQIKLRGVRLELGEVESAIAALPGVAEAAVRADGDDARVMLSAYVVPDSAAGETLPDPTSWRRDLARSLPMSWLPARWTVIEALPRTANGKIDRRLLPEPTEARASVAPRDALEARIAATWAELLDVDTVSIDAEFFELGGHSLLAVRLVRRLSRELGRDVPLSLLFTAPTVGQMADALRESDGQRAMLVPLRGEGEGEPLFCIHPIDGEIVAFRELAQRLEPGRPIVGVQDPHRAEPGQGAASIEAMAASYLESIRRVQPRGPYHLLGYSFGGVVAFDMARQLGEQGDAVALLALVDTLPPALSSRQSGGLVNARADDVELLSSLLGDTVGPAARDDLAACMDGSPADPWAAAVRWLHGRGWIDEAVDAAQLTADLDILRRRRRLLAAYRLPSGSQRLHQPMVFFRAVDEHGEGRDRTALGWVDHVEPEPLDVPIEGDHWSVLAAPGAALIAAHLAGRFADGS